jgi:hypothetical protein
MFMQRRSQLDKSESGSISFLDVLLAIPPFSRGTARGLPYILNWQHHEKTLLWTLIMSYWDCQANQNFYDPSIYSILKGVIPSKGGSPLKQTPNAPPPPHDFTEPLKP